MHKKQSKKIRNKRRRVKLNKKFEHLNDVLKKVMVEETDRSTASRQILEFDLTLKGYGNSYTVDEYLEIMRQDTIDVWQGHNDSTKAKLILKFVMARYSPESAIPIAREDNHMSTSNKEFFRGTDLVDLYEQKKVSLLSSFSKVELNGSG